MTDDVKKGKKQVVVVISILLTVSILSNLFALNIPMFLGTVTLCIFLYLGHRWARWILGILISIGLLMGAYVSISVILEGDISGPMGVFLSTLLIMLIAYGFCFYLLFFSKNVSAYFYYAKQKSLKGTSV